jgi:hypothetical protein
MAAPAGEDDSICPSLLLPEAVEAAGVGWVITTMLDLDRWGHRHLDVGTSSAAVAVGVPGVVVVATMTTIEGCLEAEEDECQAIPHWDGEEEVVVEEEEVVADQEEKVAVVDHRHHRGDRTLN